MNYDFDSIIIRRGTGCVKWDTDTAEDVIPMWVADMDFKVAPCIQQAIEKRVKHGVFGYEKVRPAYYNAVCSWFRKQHKWNIQQDSILVTTGVVPAMSAVIKAMCNKGDKVLLQSPVYNCFFSSIENNGCIMVDNPLILNGDTYQIDFEDFENKLSDKDVKLFMLCNPHNPAGRVWTKEELSRISALCLKHNVMVVADEIHCELVMPNHKYTPFASLDKKTQDNTIALCSASKSFNIAGLHIANIVCPNQEVLEKVNKALCINEICDVGPIGVEATIAAYTQGLEWIKQLNAYIYENYKLLKIFFARQFPKLQVINMEGTYLAWVDIRRLGLSSEQLCEQLIQKAKVRLNPSSMYGCEGFVRINLACPQAILQQALIRMKHSGVLD